MKRKTNEEFLMEIQELVGSEYLFLEEYKTATKKIKVKHLNEACGNYEYMVTPNNFLRGKRCPKCAGAMKKTTQQFKEEVRELEGDTYIILGEYKNARTKIELVHNTDSCGNVYKVIPDAFLKGQRCPNCMGGARKTLDYFKQQVANLVKEDYTVLSDEYINSHTKVMFRHNSDKCGFTFSASPTSFLSGSRCPRCNASKGEMLVREYMRGKGKYYLEQVTFEDLYKVSPLIYDGYLPEEDILIEYHGIQHYQPVKHFGGEERFELVKVRDELKRAYARDNGIELIEVPYTVTTLEKLENFLYKNHNL